MLLQYKCLECGQIFESNKETIEGCKNSIGTRCKKHIRNDHNMSIKNYVIKHYFNNIEPTCLCGCGSNVSFTEKNCFWDENYGFRKYVHCSHVAKNIKHEPGWIYNTLNYKSKWKNIEWIKEHYNKLYGIDNIKNAADEFLNNNDYSLLDISKKYNIDKRTIKSIWFKLNIVTEELYNNRIKYNQFNVSSKHRKIIFENYNEICERLYSILNNFPGKFTLTSLIKYFNDNNIMQIEQDRYVVLDKLLELYGDKIYEFLLYGYHSKEELDFINILKFYFGKANIIIGKKIHKTNNEYYIYDCCINNKILLEYDGEGYWHSTDSIKIRDKDKENVAINAGYKFLRISYKSSKDPNLILLIKKLIEV